MTFMALPSIRMAQILALTGLDAIIIDCEHGHISDDAMHAATAAISALGASPIIRIQGSAFPAIAHGLSTPEYMRSANEMIMAMVQIETRAGVQNVEEICAVEGVDLAFIGPNDLALSLLGYVPARGDEEVFVAAVERIVSTARRCGKWAGRMVNDGSVARRERERYDTVAITGDTKAIQNWYVAEFAIARA
ncbi:Pyruvate/Phosphoenolpyruvate kinase-like domain-containing protein [Aspergillus aurantiobrunneus]